MPPPHPFFQFAQDPYEPNLYLYKYPSNPVPVILLVHMTYEDGTDSVPKCQHIKFRRRGITQKKEYNFQNTTKEVFNKFCCKLESHYRPPPHL
jgi:hypothetical protein